MDNYNVSNADSDTTRPGDQVACGENLRTSQTKDSSQDDDELSAPSDDDDKPIHSQVSY